jgi:predicted RNA-binding protein associated with RNAse of E/G family
MASEIPKRLSKQKKPQRPKQLVSVLYPHELYQDELYAHSDCEVEYSDIDELAEALENGDIDEDEFLEKLEDF